MTKISTSKQNVNLSKNAPQLVTYDEFDAEIDLFYDQIKSRLDRLIKIPRDEIIDNILAYSKTK